VRKTRRSPGSKSGNIFTKAILSPLFDKNILINPMNRKIKLLRFLGQWLPAGVSNWLATRTKYLRHLAQPGRDLIFRRYNGDLTAIVDPKYLIELSMLSGVYDEATTGVIERFLQTDSISLDVGANVGAMTLIMAKQSPYGKVFAVEPGAKLMERLETNKSLNPLLEGVIKTFQVGMSRESGTLFWNEDPNNPGNAGLLGSSGMSVPVVTLDQFAADNKITRLDFIKIDVEGMELEVVQGGRKTIAGL
jgi:FkbM family methyltransferase